MTTELAQNGGCTWGFVHSFARDARVPARATALWNVIGDIDLSRVKAKLIHPKYGKGWLPEKADQVETRYRGFLFLTVTRAEPIVSTSDIDEMWHTHILDTRAYAADCNRVFGYFLHHFPYFGLNGADDAMALEEAFRRTVALYQSVFDEPYGDLDATGAECSAGCSSCRSCRSFKEGSNLAS